MSKKELTKLKKKAKEAVDSAIAWGKTPVGKRYEQKLDREFISMARKNKDKLEYIAQVVDAAEELVEDQAMTETLICMAALKDIRRIVRSK